MKTKSLVVMGLFLMALLFAPQVWGGTWATNCKIVEIGASTQGGGIPVAHFTCPGGTITKQFFAFEDSVATEMLATALTAFSLGETVAIRIMADGLTLDRLKMIDH